ncbi:MAG: YbaB/EbfC family nucleoid-associated protein [Candidatus Hydrogenedentes bacterium]|jgi:DNA-binding YbaB/EbfC family protein|nr:YbaB/EbfC family nucleoid-associated protein [Candidatus Hydrogenedentota bacterium]
MLKGLGDLGKMGGLIKQAMEMKERMETLKSTLADERVEFSVAGEVSVTLNGNMEVVSLTINPGLLQSEDAETIEGVITAAMNGALEKTRALVKSKMSDLAGLAEIPGIF